MGRTRACRDPDGARVRRVGHVAHRWPRTGRRPVPRAHLLGRVAHRRRPERRDGAVAVRRHRLSGWRRHLLHRSEGSDVDVDDGHARSHRSRHRAPGTRATPTCTPARTPPTSCSSATTAASPPAPTRRRVGSTRSRRGCTARAPRCRLRLLAERRLDRAGFRSDRHVQRHLGGHVDGGRVSELAERLHRPRWHRHRPDRRPDRPAPGLHVRRRDHRGRCLLPEPYPLVPSEQPEAVGEGRLHRHHRRRPADHGDDPVLRPARSSSSRTRCGRCSATTPTRGS